jgi:hypothetical protein
VASAGCAWYIERLLSDANVFLDVRANPGNYSPLRGLEIRLPEKSPFFSSHLGINKVAVVRESLRGFPKVAFAGQDWVAAFHAAPSVKPGFYTILSERDYADDLTQVIDHDPRLEGLYYG